MNVEITADMRKQLEALGVHRKYIGDNPQKILNAVKAFWKKHKRPVRAVDLYMILPEIENSRIRFVMTELERQKKLIRVQHGKYVPSPA